MKWVMSALSGPSWFSSRVFRSKVALMFGSSCALA